MIFIRLELVILKYLVYLPVKHLGNGNGRKKRVYLPWSLNKNNLRVENSHLDRFDLDFLSNLGITALGR